MDKTNPIAVAGRARYTSYINVPLLLFLLLLSLFKYFLFSYFSDSAALFSADFILVNLLIVSFCDRIRNLLLFIYNVAYFVVFISLTFINFFHFTWKSFCNSLQFYQQLDYTRYIFMALLLVGVVLALYFTPRLFFKKTPARHRLLNILLCVVLLGISGFVQKKFLIDYHTFTTNDHTKFRKIFPLIDRGDIYNVVEEDRMFVYDLHSTDTLSSFATTMRSTPSFLKYNPDEPGAQVAVLLESFGKLTDGPLQSLFRDSIQQWMGNDYELVFDSVAFNGSTVDGELRELFDLRGDYNKLLDAGRPFSSIFTERKEKGYATWSVSSSGGKVFSDRQLYKAGGCDSSFFKEDLMALPYFDKGRDMDKESVFSGVRDEFSYDFLLRKLDGGQAKRFGYFLTINTHLPFWLSADTKETPAYISFHNANAAAYSNDVIDLTWKFVLQLRYFVTQAAAHHLNSLLLVGDHSPPYFASGDRAHYSQQTVPVYFIHRRIVK